MASDEDWEVPAVRFGANTYQTSTLTSPPPLDDVAVTRNIDNALDTAMEPEPLEGHPTFHCPVCGFPFPKNKSRLRHLRTTKCGTFVGVDKLKFPCEMCSKSFTRNDTRERHIGEVHSGISRFSSQRPQARSYALPPSRSAGPSTQMSEHCTTALPMDLELPGMASNAGNDYPCGSVTLRHSSRKSYAQELIFPLQVEPSAIGMAVTTPYSISDENSIGSSSQSMGSSTSASSISEHSREADKFSPKTTVLDVALLRKTSRRKLPPPWTGPNTEGNGHTLLGKRREDELTSENTGPKESLCRLANRDPAQGIDAVNDCMERLGVTSGSYPVKCTVCKKPYERNSAQLLAHLHRHLEELKQEHLCISCNIGFLHDADLKHHEQSVMNGDCGFRFKHFSPCTGHHPSNSSGDGRSWSEDDHIQLGYTVRGWELSQLHTHQDSVAKLEHIRSRIGTPSFWSLPDARDARRTSLASLSFSLFSSRSTPVTVDYGKRSRVVSFTKSIVRPKLTNTQPSFELPAKHRCLKTELNAAVLSGNLEQARILMCQGAHVDCKTDLAEASQAKRAPLVMASEKGHLPIVQLLLKYRADPDTSDVSGRNALQAACMHGHSNILHALVEAGADLSLLDYQTRGAVDQALQKHSAKFSRALYMQLENQGQSCTGNPLCIAVMGGDQAQVTRLLDTGTDPNHTAIFPHGLVTALYLAAMKERVNIMQELLSCGAKANGSGPNGTALGWVLAHYHQLGERQPELIELLVSNGASLDCCWTTHDAFWTAASYGGSATLSNIIKTVSHHRDIALYLDTAVHACSWKGDTSDLEFLLDQGADANCFSVDGHSPLCRAMAGGSFENVSLLLHNGANPNHQHTCHGSPLLLAVQTNREDLLQLLLAYGADPDLLVEASDTTAVRAAASQGSSRLISLLISHVQTPRSRPDSNLLRSHPGEAAGADGQLAVAPERKRGRETSLERHWSGEEPDTTFF